MSVQTFACPACGTRKSLPDAHPGEKIHCTCGMSFPASPVFAVADAGPKKSGSARSLAVLVVVVLMVGGSVTSWLVNRPGPQKAVDRQVAAAPPVGEPQPPPTPEPKPEETPATSTTLPPDSASVLRPEEKAPTDSQPPPPPAPPPPPPTPVATLSAVTLWDAFDLDPAAAATRFEGKVVEVIGQGRVAEDSLGRPYFGVVVVKPGGRKPGRVTTEERSWEKDGYPPSVRLYLTPEQAEALEKASPDQDVVVRGTCTGRKTVDGVYRGYIVEIGDCVVMSPK